jgi:threonine synthase
MRYVSTRGEGGRRSFSEILLDGIAPDGGLYVPVTYPALEWDALRGLSYPEVATRVLALFGPERAWETVTQKTYTKEHFGSGEIAPLTPLGAGRFLLELSNGPTLAFKDMAMQLLGNLFEEALTETGQAMTVLGATSGDTGGAAEEALRGKKNVQVVMLSPEGRVSPFQAAQMYSLPDPNIHNLVVRGVFDECQDIVKALSADESLKKRHLLGAVNSINGARIAAQVVYYVWAALKLDMPGDFVVPSGNFGNVLAGWIAQKIGAPIRRLIVATNENDVLAEFFATGVYRPRPAEAVAETESPSMDIAKASNFERYVFERAGRDPELTRRLLALPELTLPGTDAGLLGGSSTKHERFGAMKHVWETFGRLIDPHTAAGIVVGEQLATPGVPLVFLETALPCKFEDAVFRATGTVPPRPPGFENIETRPQKFTCIEADPEAVRDYLERIKE